MFEQTQGGKRERPDIPNSSRLQIYRNAGKYGSSYRFSRLTSIHYPLRNRREVPGSNVRLLAQCLALGSRTRFGSPQQHCNPAGASHFPQLGPLVGSGSIQ